MSLNKVAKAAILALAMFSNAGIAEARAAKPQPAAAEPPKRVADDPGCRSCTQQAASMFARGEASAKAAQRMELTLPQLGTAAHDAGDDLAFDGTK
jgi:hypothetical protein